MAKDYKQEIANYLELEMTVLRKLDTEEISAAMNILEEARQRDAAIYVCGNGGSAATASHMVCDFNKGVSLKQTKKYRFICLNDNVPNMMAIANDLGYDQIFKVPLENKITSQDVLLAISGSGNSKNVVNAVKYAKEHGATVIGMTGYNGGEVRKLADAYLHVPIDNMQITEDIHMIFDHMMMWILSHGGDQC